MGVGAREDEITTPTTGRPIGSEGQALAGVRILPFRRAGRQAFANDCIQLAPCPGSGKIVSDGRVGTVQ
jgi:hypothetical protein